MAHIILVTGGSRSGKSAHALEIAQRLGGPRAFIATCPALDDEMRARIRMHRNARQQLALSEVEGAGWRTIEETDDLAGALARTAHCRVALVDCLTLWINNLLYHAEQAGRAMEESDIQKHCEAVLSACAPLAGTVLFVTNEVGWGIIPENASARRFRDLSGRCNTVMAAGADEVVLVVCGLPIHLKKGD
ncbi:MAG: bifunctional adenosylcobinamide kinase/adenosylcobinamide-phosphate guanylyltransferase [Candidatus Brocadiia bacterium]